MKRERRPCPPKVQDKLTRLKMTRRTKKKDRALKLENRALQKGRSHPSKGQDKLNRKRGENLKWQGSAPVLAKKASRRPKVAAVHARSCKRKQAEGQKWQGFVLVLAKKSKQKA
ncbi:uncharacterized protein G2W53_003663 [Senna tora]|uniref:Uncharacterized protein n=1 Tax=Senna tora TaxID=362788 RepID=A0A835CIM1_9FABA|nr:uncharacterized protein G2W53_003663 [Senna tora]